MAPKKRTYNDLCGLSHALELVGERWAVLVLRELTYGPKRFTDIRAGLPAASPNVLSQRLRELEGHGIVRRRTLAPPAASKVYELTDWGRELEPALRSLGAWAARSPYFPESGHFSPSAMAMNLESMFRPENAAGVDAVFGLRFGEEEFRMQIQGGELTMERGEGDDHGEPDAVIDADPMALVGVLYHGAELSAAESSGAIRIQGDREAVEALPGMFELPAPVEFEEVGA